MSADDPRTAARVIERLRQFLSAKEEEAASTSAALAAAEKREARMREALERVTSSAVLWDEKSDAYTAANMTPGVPNAKKKKAFHRMREAKSAWVKAVTEGRRALRPEAVAEGEK